MFMVTWVAKGYPSLPAFLTVGGLMYTYDMAYKPTLCCPLMQGAVRCLCSGSPSSLFAFPNFYLQQGSAWGTYRSLRSVGRVA
jgi:hypothetical protein